MCQAFRPVKSEQSYTGRSSHSVSAFFVQVLGIAGAKLGNYFVHVSSLRANCKQASLIAAFRIIGVLFWAIIGKPRPADFNSVILIVSWNMLTSLQLVVSCHLSCFDWFSSFVLVILAVLLVCYDHVACYYVMPLVNGSALQLILHVHHSCRALMNWINQMTLQDLKMLVR